MIGIIHHARQFRGKEDTERGEQHRYGAHGPPGRRKDLLPPVQSFRFAGEAEITGLHPHRQHHHRERNQCIHIGNHTVLARGHDPGQERGQQVVQQPGYDAADTVNGGLSGQLSEHAVKRLLSDHWYSVLRLSISGCHRCYLDVSPRLLREVRPSPTVRGSVPMQPGHSPYGHLHSRTRN